MIFDFVNLIKLTQPSVGSVKFFVSRVRNSAAYLMLTKEDIELHFNISCQVEVHGMAKGKSVSLVIYFKSKNMKCNSEG